MRKQKKIGIRRWDEEKVREHKESRVKFEKQKVGNGW